MYRNLNKNKYVDNILNIISDKYKNKKKLSKYRVLLV